MNINDLMKENLAAEDTPDKDVKQDIELADTIVVKGKHYKIKPLKWGDAIDLWENILKVVLPSLGSTTDFMIASDSKNNVNLDSVFSKAAMQLSKNLSGSSLSTFSRVLLHGATVDGKPLDIDKEFTRNYSAWMQVFAYSLKVNYSSFFEGGLGVNGLIEMVAQQGQEETVE